MEDTELDKFWKSGYDAHLDIDAHAGQAWVGLRLCLGHVEGFLHHHDRSRDSPCKPRRRARRAEARQEKCEKRDNYETEKSNTEVEEASAAKDLCNTFENEAKKEAVKEISSL